MGRGGGRERKKWGERERERKSFDNLEEVDSLGRIFVGGMVDQVFVHTACTHVFLNLHLCVCM